MPGRYAISGRVLDPHNLRPEDAILMLGRQEGESSVSWTPVQVAADGRFIARFLIPGPYTLEVIRMPHSAVEPAVPVAFNVVHIENATVRERSVV